MRPIFAPSCIARGSDQAVNIITILIRPQRGTSERRPGGRFIGCGLSRTLADALLVVGGLTLTVDSPPLADALPLTDTTS
jgi:hypothetical protein